MYVGDHQQQNLEHPDYFSSIFLGLWCWSTSWPQRLPEAGSSSRCTIIIFVQLL